MKKHAQSHIFAPQPPAARQTAASPLERQIAVTLYNQGNFGELERYTRNLSAQYPGDGFGWKLLGAALKQQGRATEALEPMQTAASIMPMDWEAFNNLGSTHQALGNLDYADACYRRAIELKPDFANAIGNLAEVALSQGKLNEALALFQRRLKISPDDGYTQHLVNTLSQQTTSKAPAQYVAQVFDTYADTFDAHLQGDLRCQVPSQLATLVKSQTSPSPDKWDVLDLGCGTGLAGVTMAPMARQMVGVDLSARMLEKAHERQIYQRLVCADIHDMLKDEADASYDVIVSADVFVYIGKLDTIIQEARRLLRPNGVLAFSVETLEADQGDYRLETTGRYSQSLTYMNRLATEYGFEVLQMQPTVLRYEKHTPVNGYLGLWKR
ncbi:MAG: methyltransferase domain-containing protein [Aquabacterium sp.]|uniref:methyltransferase domain-containing protein n=1 Tax=Aquabacterium sp. TaxID=1872578 RepID=UPI0025BAE4EF|nr:methyltransferase domain-containing protein [Aquabacterium sp.]MBI5925602.1 methyltransferase domain-containing protein [Aquabacterium sp.]